MNWREKTLIKHREQLLNNDIITKYPKKKIRKVGINSIEISSMMDYKAYKGASIVGKNEGSKKQAKVRIQMLYGLINRITGKKPKIIKAKKSVASFNIRSGMELGVKTTLRKKDMERNYKNYNLIILPMIGIRRFTNLEKEVLDKRNNIDYSMTEILSLQPINSFMYKQRKRNESIGGKNKTIKEWEELAKLEKLWKTEAYKTGINLRYNVLEGQKTQGKKKEEKRSLKGFVLSYYLIPVKK